MNGRSASMKQCTPIELTRLSNTFQPRDNDVICGRGRKGFHHQGNIKFKKSIQDKLDEYTNTSERNKKSMLVSSMLDKCRESETLFLKLDENLNRWYDIGDKKARQKIAHTFRDFNRSQKESGTRMSERHVSVFKRAKINQNTMKPSLETVPFRRNIKEKHASDSLLEHIGVATQPVQRSDVPTACHLPRVEHFEKRFRQFDKYEEWKEKSVLDWSLLLEFRQRGYLKTMQSG